MGTSRSSKLAYTVGLALFLSVPSTIVAAQYGTHLRHTTTSDNTALNHTVFESILTNDDPDAIIQVTPVWDVGGGGSSNDHPIGVWYESGTGVWWIFNEDFAVMPLDTAFHVWIPPAGASSFVHTASGTNSSGHITTIDNPLTNNNPSALLLVTQNFNPGGGTGILNGHPIGVYYATPRWRIFNQDGAPMPAGASFNVTVLPDDQTAFVHTSAGGPNTMLDHPLLNGRPNAIIQVTQNWNPVGSSGVYNSHEIGLFYGFDHWWIFNQDFVDMSSGASFNVSVPSLEEAFFFHQASISDSYTQFHRPLTDGNHSAMLFVTQAWPASGLGTFNDHRIGVLDDGLSWGIINLDLADMLAGAGFNIFVPAVDASTFVHTAFYPVGDTTTIDNPLTNGDPDAILHVTPNVAPSPIAPGVYDDHEIAVQFDGSKWAIVNQDFAAMPLKASFNVWVPPADASTFVHTATAGNLSGTATVIDHPTANDNPDAILMVTRNLNPGGGSSFYYHHELGVAYSSGLGRWAIFTQDKTNMVAGPSFNVTVLDTAFFSDGFESGDTTAWSAVSP